MPLLKLIQRVGVSLLERAAPSKFWPTVTEISKMDKVFVRCVEGEQNMTISFTYGTKKSSLNRPQNEALEKSLSRIQCTLKKFMEKEMKKKHKKMKLAAASENVSTGETELSVGLMKNDIKVDVEISNESAWNDGTVMSINETNYQVCRNYPVIQQLCLPTFVLAGCPVFPRMTTEFANAKDCEYKWFRHVKHNVTEKGAGETESRQDSGLAQKEWIEVGQDKVYVPTAADVGWKLKLVCTPKNGEKAGEGKDTQTMRAVTNGPAIYPFEKRHAFTKERTPTECFRIVSYNILADMYADSDFSRDYLYPYCPPMALDVDYREQLILKEITGYNADILCLQECGKRIFEHSLKPALKDQGFSGLLYCKARNTSEGEAIFFREDRFRCLEQYDISLADAFQNEPSNADLVQAVSKSSAMLSQVITRTSVVQVTILEDNHNPSRRLCVANTHLFFHPRAGHIRLIQTALILRHLEKIKLQHAEKFPETQLAILLCGDLNSAPSCPGVYELISKKCIPSNHVQWYAGGKEEFCGGLLLTHSLNFTNACVSQDYTNFVAGFMASLDYVLIDEGQLEVSREIPMPSHDDVTAHVALPNEVFPSDHLAIGCDVRWK